MWKGVIDVALIGTEKKKLNLGFLPSPIAELLYAEKEGNAQQVFLNALSYLYFYNEQGKTSIQFKGDLNQQVIIESQVLANEEYLKIFNKIKELDHYQKEPFLKEWMSFIVERDKIISPNLIIPLLEFGANLSKSVKKEIIKIIGEKGRAVIPMATQLPYQDLDYAGLEWEEGSNSQRLELFKQLRKEDPAQAILMLKASWDTEGVRTKKSLLNEIDDHLQQSDLAFLEQLYQSEFLYTLKENKTKKECRMLLAAMLLRLAASNLYQETSAELSKYIAGAKKKGLIGKIQKSDDALIQLPEKEDAFFNDNNMLHKFGLENVNIDPGVYGSKIQYWFAFFILALPMKFWEKHTAKQGRIIAKMFLQDKAFQLQLGKSSNPIYKDALVDHCKYHHEESIIKLLFANYPIEEVVHLLKYLSLDTYELLVINRNLHTDRNVLLNSPSGIWNLAFAEQVVEKHYDLIANQNQWIKDKIGREISTHMNIDILPALLKFNDFAKNTRMYSNWQKQFFEPLHLGLEIKNLIKNLKVKI